MCKLQNRADEPRKPCASTIEQLLEDTPDTQFGTAQFGVISSAGEAREIQLGMKYTF